MTLISSVSGIRGTVGGEPAKNLTPIDVVLFTSSFAFLIQSKYDFDCSLIVGRCQEIRTDDTRTCNEYFNWYGNKKSI